MATYVVLGNFTDQGIRSVKDTTKRADALKERAKSLGITMKEVYWTLGRNGPYGVWPRIWQGGQSPHADPESLLADRNGRDPK